MKEETLSMIHKAKEGDREALSVLVRDNMGLVQSCVRRFRGRGVEYEDLFQIGCMGLVKAIQRFRAEAGVELSTYAVPVILGEIRRYFRDDGWIKVSRSVKETARRIWEVQTETEMTTGQSPTLTEIAEILEVSVEEITFAMEASAPAHSLEECVYQGSGQPISLGDALPSKENGEEEALNRVMVFGALRKCSPEEKSLIYMRYYQGKTQSETARVLGVSQVQVSRMEKRILGKMRKSMEKEEIL